MEGPRSKVVKVGGRDFVVRPLFGKVAKELASISRGDPISDLVALVAVTLQRTAPDVTEQWLLENGDMAEYRDVQDALTEVTTGKKPSQGEAPAPSTGEKSTP